MAARATWKGYLKVSLVNINEVSAGIIVCHQINFMLTPFARLDPFRWTFVLNEFISVRSVVRLFLGLYLAVRTGLSES